jgi:N6-adenosine-specific RNA methylase IME4
MSELLFHPLANLFPLIEGEEFEGLRDDIKANGLRETIKTLDGMIIDGRNRYRACRELGVDVNRYIVAFDSKLDGDPLAFVISMNLKRRHLDESQRAMIAARLETVRHGGDRRSDQDANWHVDRDAAARLLNVSRRSVARAASVRDYGQPELQRAVDRGNLAVSLAAQAVKLPVTQQREIAEKAQAGEANVVRNVVKRAARTAREAELGKKLVALPNKRYGVILADPEWQFEPWSRETGMDRAADNHYPTSVLDVIAARDAPSIAADDCVLFLWATVPMLPQALLVIARWGFAYRSHFVWKKDRLGTGYWNRNLHELLLVGVRGEIPAPAMGEQWQSLIDAPVGEHSAKPAKFLELIEAYFPTLPKIELNRRGPPRAGWDAWAHQPFATSADTMPDEAGRSILADLGAQTSTEPLRRSAKQYEGDDPLGIPTYLRRGHPNCVLGKSK